MRLQNRLELRSFRVLSFLTWSLTASDEEHSLFKRLSSQPVDADVLDEVDEAAAHAISQLGLLRDSEPQAIASAIRTHVDAVRPLSGEELDETAIVLASLWAEQIRRA